MERSERQERDKVNSAGQGGPSPSHTTCLNPGILSKAALTQEVLWPQGTTDDTGSGKAGKVDNAQSMAALLEKADEVQSFLCLDWPGSSKRHKIEGRVSGLSILLLIFRKYTLSWQK